MAVAAAGAEVLEGVAVVEPPAKAGTIRREGEEALDAEGGDTPRGDLPLPTGTLQAVAALQVATEGRGVMVALSGRTGWSLVPGMQGEGVRRQTRGKGGGGVVDRGPAAGGVTWVRGSQRTRMPPHRLPPRRQATTSSSARARFLVGHRPAILPMRQQQQQQAGIQRTRRPLPYPPLLAPKSCLLCERACRALRAKGMRGMIRLREWMAVRAGVVGMEGGWAAALVVPTVPPRPPGKD